MRTNTQTYDDKEIIITRTFTAPGPAVWRAWTQPACIEEWWGPRGFTTRVDELNFTPGGSFKYTMIDAEGNEYPSVGVFQEITEHQRIVATDEFGDSDAINNVTPENGLPTGMISTTTFSESDEQTTVTIRIMHQSADDRKKHEKMGVIEGFNEQLDKLNEYLNP